MYHKKISLVHWFSNVAAPLNHWWEIIWETDVKQFTLTKGAKVLQKDLQFVSKPHSLSLSETGRHECSFPFPLQLWPYIQHKRRVFITLEAKETSRLQRSQSGAYCFHSWNMDFAYKLKVFTIGTQSVVPDQQLPDRLRIFQKCKLTADLLNQ